MKKMLFASALTGALVLSACGSEDQSGSSENSSEDKPQLVMGTSADYRPFEYVDTANGEEIIGYDIDLANMIADELGFEFTIKDMEFSGLITALQNEQVDFVLAAMTPTEERKENVEFTDIYYVAQDMIISLDGSGITSPEDLDGKTVGVQLGSIQQEYVDGLAEKMDVTVETRNRIPELMQDVINERFDAIIVENTVAEGYLNNSEELTGNTIEVEEQEAGSAVALPLGSEWTEQFNEVLAELEESGELEKLAEKWFDAEASE
ncbi:ABC transporter substrate-binding protein [Jeotgalibacillus alimentarius]|uniref:ABC transporter substrate-binding protein n=1 Tax=Jeotgalibacillus alimentarius TaxID=135826 RepID=A0A0C2VX95_9BACL|nr:transporter substrate-binding domain-containing protein [Jeotgalibacillus alimentarius]KIL49021.1 ABC transporter substrate-binding protein [Jeotgalibacillus alimentarius]